jgi:hypothetical protein
VEGEVVRGPHQDARQRQQEQRSPPHFWMTSMRSTWSSARSETGTSACRRGRLPSGGSARPATGVPRPHARQPAPGAVGGWCRLGA